MLRGIDPKPTRDDGAGPAPEPTAVIAAAASFGARRALGRIGAEAVIGAAPGAVILTLPTHPADRRNAAAARRRRGAACCFWIRS
jgi:hypothetical protein